MLLLVDNVSERLDAQPLATIVSCNTRFKARGAVDVVRVSTKCRCFVLLFDLLYMRKCRAIVALSGGFNGWLDGEKAITH